ncbi:cytochrome b/b6 domain-containing protein [Gluconacetobacter diazotrophicus]|uniref:Cytochrome b/b6 domain-containing protein n=1 Tax=Gluconacetobacter diazotrophicus TaxID=33996 RepID=A0A7W4I5T1_GLUDI|nr:cytochrome b/b6 domain-containing protein [Gluconacetobacter diazotrophicus]MBB2156788.1 cytochrome b/b6 domain-containing protein [Gluconacetobacter diazotrophicus]
MPRPRRTPAPVIRITHWIGALSMLVMIGSGWQIYNASPILPFTFPPWMTLGGWLAGGIAWHFAAMWTLMGAGLVYVAYGVVSGHFRRDLRPQGVRAVRRDMGLALRFRLPHAPGRYNAVQRLLYTGVLIVATLTVASGLSIWKPVQLGWLTWLFGGYDIARRIHFTMMALIVGFLVVHVVLALIVPSTLFGMVFGRRPVPHDSEAAR